MIGQIQCPYFHKAQFNPVSTSFSATFGAVTPGLYDFTNTAACQNVQAFPLQYGVMYWIKNLSVAANTQQENYLGAINAFPTIRVGRLMRSEGVYRDPIAIDKYIDNASCEAWLNSDQKDDFLTLSLTGSFIQLPAMIGLLTMIINVTFYIYSFNDQDFMADFRGDICK